MRSTNDGTDTARALPAPLSPLVGRSREVEAGLRLLSRDGVRLVTLAGPGGIGKTRLAREMAVAAAGAFPGGVCFVDLSAVGDAALVAPAIARALDLRETGDEPLVSALKRHLRERPGLLVLDNFEQVLPAGALVADLLAACPGLKVLVTSRTTVRVSGNHELPVPPLSLPPAGAAADPDALARSEAVALFVQRARAAKPDFALTAENARDVADICARLEGLPLAIELAAARTRRLPVHALRERLGNRLGLLTGGPHDLPQRHQTLRATIEWSYRLLEPPGRALFARLAVFTGGCTIESAESVGGAPEAAPLDVLDGLGALVDQSLVRAQETGGELRFSMLETIREYALERLAADGEAATLRRRHAEHFLDLVGRAAPELAGPQQAAWLQRLDREHDNLRAALDWALETGEDELALRLAGALGQFWEVRGHLTEGWRRLEAVLAACGAGSPTARAAALGAAGSLVYFRCDYQASAELLAECLRIRQSLGDRVGVATALHHLSRVRFYQGDHDQAGVLCQESLAIRRELGDRRGVALSLNTLGVMARNRRDHTAARAIYEECLAVFRDLGDRWGTSLILNNLARVSRDLADWDDAAALCAESLALFRELGDRHGVAWVLSNLGIIAQRRADPSRAAHLFGAAEALGEAIGSSALSLSPAERAAFEAAYVAVRADLGEAAFAAGRAAGRALPLEEAIELALATAAARSAAPPAPPPGFLRPAGVPAAEGDCSTERLTRREREVAAQVARGLTDREIAAALFIAEGTVGVHLERVFGKLGIRSRAQLAAWAVERGLVADSRD